MTRAPSHCPTRAVRPMPQPRSRQACPCSRSLCSWSHSANTRLDGHSSVQYGSLSSSVNSVMASQRLSMSAARSRIHSRPQTVTRRTGCQPDALVASVVITQTPWFVRPLYQWTRAGVKHIRGDDATRNNPESPADGESAPSLSRPDRGKPITALPG